MKKIVSLLFSGVLLFTIATPPLAYANENIPPKNIVQMSGPKKIKDTYMPDEVLVKFKDPQQKGFRLLASENIDVRVKNMERTKKLTMKKKLKEVNAALFEKKGEKIEKLIAELEKDPNVEWAQPNYIYMANVDYLDTQIKNWNIGNGSNSGINADLVHSQTTGNGVVVAVIDTGVDWDHPDLSNNHWTNTSETSCSNGVDDDGNGFIDDCNGYDFVGGSINLPNPDNDPTDQHGHGTHVAGTIAAEDNTIGVLGVAPDATIMPVKVLDNNGGGTSASVIAGIDYARKNGADIINMSLGGPGNDPLMEAAVNNANTAGVLVVSAAGNNGNSTPHYPAAYSNVFSVGAIDSDQNRASFSNTGSTLDIMAPGVNIISTYPEHLTPSGYVPYATSSGTSMATPHISGLAALYLQKNPSATPIQIQNAITGSATDLGTTGRDDLYGYGAANAAELFATTPPPPSINAGDVVINELAWAGSSINTSDEWIELRNMTNAAIDLSGFQITNSAGTESVMITIPQGKSIPANGYFLISNYAETNASSVLNTTPDVVDTAVQLNNSNIQFKLYSGDFATATLIDTADDGNGIPFAGSNDAPKKTMSRKSVPGDGTVATNWFTSEVAGTGYDLGVDQKGTPGEANIEGTSDSTPPVISGNNITLPVGTTNTTLEATTDENATCKYETSSGIVYDSMTNTFGTTGTTTHQQTINGLTDGSTQDYFIRCKDASENKNTTDYQITIKVETPADTTPPVRSNGAPSGEQVSGTTSVTLSVTTDEAATCKYGTTSGTAYDSMANTFGTTGTTSHSTTFGGLSDGQSYSVFVRCMDGVNNKNTDDYTISFSVANPVDSTPPVISGNNITLPAGTTTTTLEATTDENATCKYGTTASVVYDSIANTFTTTGGTTHQQTINGLTDGSTQNYFIRCKDGANNANTTDYQITVTVQTPADTTPPVRSNGSPSGEQVSGTTSVTLSVTTDEAATCKYGTTGGTAYDSMANTFGTTGTTSHSTTFGGLSDGQSYSVFVRCMDGVNNKNTDDYTISFSVAQSTTPPPAQDETIYEDGNSASDWKIYDNSPNFPVVPSVTAQGGKIVTRGNGTANMYGMFFPQPNASQFIAEWEWELDTKQLQRIYFRVNTNEGVKYLRYRPENKTCASSGSEYVYCGIGTGAANGDPQTFRRNLVTDMTTAKPNVKINSVSAVYISGDSKIDNIKLIGDQIPSVETYSISGKVTKDGNPLPNAIISFSHNTLTAPADVNTNASGNYSQNGFIANETYTVRVKADGVDFATDSVQILVNGNKTVDFSGTTPPPGSKTVYEDGNSASDWSIFDKSPNTPVTPSVTAKNGMIHTESNGTLNGFSLSFGSPNTEQFIAEWDWKLAVNELQRLYFRIVTNKGAKYIRYRPEYKQCSLTSDATYIYCGVGPQTANGNINTITRNLVEDVQTADSTLNITSVTDVYLRGNMDIDNIALQD